MSFRELRNFTEIMRSLGYPRRISVENFRTPNFELVADVLYWMVQRYDPMTSLSDNIQHENDRVEFLTTICQVMATKARISLRAKNLYAADGRAVKELLKIANVLYSAMQANKASIAAGKTGAAGADADSSPAELPQDTSSTRTVASEITAYGAKLFDLLKDEQKLRVARQKALQFLDAISGNLDSRAEHDYMERSIRDAIASVQDNVASLEKQVKELSSDQRNLESKIKKKQADLERSEKRLRSLQSVRPAFMDEYERLERELADEYEVYLEKFRNLDYLEHELDLYNQREKEKVEASNRALKRLQKRLRDEETRIILGEGEVDEDALSKTPPSGGGGGSGSGSGGRKADGAHVVGSMHVHEDSDDTESTGSDVTGSSSDGHVSFGSSRSGSSSGSDSGSLGMDDDDDDDDDDVADGDSFQSGDSDSDDPFSDNDAF